MYSLPYFRKMLNLNWKKSKIMWIYEKENNLIFQIRWKYNCTKCINCWLNTSKRKDKKLHKQKTLVKHMPFWWNKMIELELHKRHFRCNNCKTDFYEKFDFMSDFGQYTNDFEKYIQWNWGFVSGNKLAELYGASNGLIHSILDRIDENLINEKWIEIMEKLDEIYLWVDEHSFSGHDMVLIITELKTGQLLAVLDWITKEKLDYWIWHVVPLKCHKKIIWYSTDMNKGYANSLGEICWNPIQSVDKMHLFIEANRVIDQVRDISRHTLQMNFVKVEDIPKLWKKCNEKITVEDVKRLNNSQNNTKIEVMKKYKEKVDNRLKIVQINKKDLYNSKGEKIDYSEITPEYFIEKWYRKLFLYREKNLSWQQKLRLNQIFREFDYLWFLQEAWTLKEDFMDALDELNIAEIDRIRDDCLKSEHYRIKQFWRTIKRWYSWIKGFCEHSTKEFKFTNALTEGINNLCKVAKRISHGFSSKVMYIKKLTARFCLRKLEI